MGRQRKDEFSVDFWLSKFGDWYIPEPNTGCWLWTRSGYPNGYGSQWFGGKLTGAHRVSYRLLRGPIPSGMCLDHLCRTRCCVNPDHLEAVTQRENLLRGRGFPAVNIAKTHCPRGHSLENAETWNGGRKCRICRRERDRERYRRLRRARPAQCNTVVSRQPK